MGDLALAMVFAWHEKRQTENVGSGFERRPGVYEEECRKALLAAEQRWPALDFIDPTIHLGGELLGYFLGVPYDWDTLDPDLMKEVV